MKKILSQICFTLGFFSIAFSVLAYSYSGIDMATYIGLWVPSFFLVGFYFDKE